MNNSREITTTAATTATTDDKVSSKSDEKVKELRMKLYRIGSIVDMLSIKDYYWDSVKTLVVFNFQLNHCSNNVFG